MPEVFLLCEFPTLNGGERSMLSTMPGVKAAGFTPVALCPPHGPLADAFRSENIEVMPFETFDTTGKRRSQQNLREALSAIVSRRPPALFHANSLAMGRLCGPAVAENKVPSLSHLRDIIKISAQAIADLNQNTRLLAVSHAVRDFHLAQGLSAEKTFVLYNGVDLGSFQPTQPSRFLHRELHLPDDAILIGTVGQIGLRKGQDVLIDAAIRWADELPNVHLLLFGQRCSGKEESRDFELLLERASAGPLHGRLHLLGYRNDMRDVYAELALLVHPARQEPLGRVLLEAGAMGVPILATNVGGTAEIFPPQSDAVMLVPPNDFSALYDGISKLVRDISRRKSLAINARRRIEAAFDIRFAAPNLLEHYKALLES